VKFLNDLSKLLNKIDFKQLDKFLEKLKAIHAGIRRKAEPYYTEYLRRIDPFLVKIKWHKTKHIAWVTGLIVLMLYLNASPPFQAIASGSMEPTLSVGDLVFIKKVQTTSIQVGDVIVYRVPQIFQDRYGYPPTVCHRVVDVQLSAGMVSFRTKGDATGQDPFMVETSSVIGKQSATIPLAGYLVMFPQSRPGWIFIIGAIILYFAYIKSDFLSLKTKSLKQKYQMVTSNEFQSSQKDLETKITVMNDKVAESMNSFSEAMSEYAQHIASHTAAVQSLAKAAQHLEQVVSIRGAQPGELPVRREVSGARGINETSRLMLQTPINVTPELKAALLDFLRDYARQRNLSHLEMTPEVRSAAWEFVNRYARLHQNNINTTTSLSTKLKREKPSGVVQI